MTELHALQMPASSLVRRDVPAPSDDNATVWGSDAIADMLRAMDIPFVLLTRVPVFAACTIAWSTTWVMKSRR